MVKLIGPCMSLDARGQLGKALIFAKNGKTNYSKSYAVPANPRSPAQTVQRMVVRSVTQQWASLTAPQQASWLTLAAQRQTTAYHAYLWYNLDRWRRGLLPVPNPVDDTPGDAGNFEVHYYPTEGTIEIEAATEAGADEPYCCLIVASLDGGTLFDFANAVLLLFNPIQQPSTAWQFNATWQSPLVGYNFVGGRMIQPDGDLSNWYQE